MMVGGLHIGQLVALSLKDPANAARHVIELRLTRDVLWTMLVLACALNAILFWVSSFVTPPLPPEFADRALVLPSFLGSPILVFVFSAGAMVVMIHLLHWVGSAMGGDGALGDMLSVFVWMQALRVAAQAGAIVLLLIAPPIASIFGLVVAVMSLWIMVHFINQGANLGSLLKTIGLLFIVVFGFIFGMSLFLTITGLATMGLEQSV